MPLWKPPGQGVASNASVAPLTENCNLIYVELGSNRGDALQNFADKRPDPHLYKALIAADANWLPEKSCIYAFEPNPKWTKELHRLRKSLQPRVAQIAMYTETAAVHDDRTTVKLFLDSSQLSETSSIAYGKRFRSGISVRAMNLHAWLTSKFANSPIPIVVRMDIEGYEYELLSSLLTQYTPSHFPKNTLHIAVEWHRYVKKTSLGQVETSKMKQLDKQYNWVAGDKAALVDTYEKQLHYWLEKVGVKLFM